MIFRMQVVTPSLNHVETTSCEENNESFWIPCHLHVNLWRTSFLLPRGFSVSFQCLLCIQRAGRCAVQLNNMLFWVMPHHTTLLPDFASCQLSIHTISSFACLNHTTSCPHARLSQSANCWEPWLIKISSSTAAEWIMTPNKWLWPCFFNQLSHHVCIKWIQVVTCSSLRHAKTLDKNGSLIDPSGTESPHTQFD